MDNARFTLRLTIALAGLASATALAASPTHGVAVSATVLSKSVCRFNDAGPSALAFGTIDPSGTGPVTASVGIVFKCTGSVATATYAITGDDGLYASGAGSPRMRHATVTTDFLPYSLNVPASGSVPKNVDTPFTLVGTIAQSDYANARVGSFADSVVLTIAP